MISNTEFKWPEVLITGEIPSNRIGNKQLLLADGLLGWANCMAGNAPPTNFGIGMKKIGEQLHILPTYENLSILYHDMEKL